MRRQSILAIAFVGLVVMPVQGPVRAEDDVARVRQAGRACLMAERALKVGALDRAQEQFEQALALQPRFPNAHIGLGHVAMAREAFDTAFEQYRAAHASFGDLGDLVRQTQAQRYRSARNDIAALRDEIERLQRFSGSIATTQMIFQIENQIAQLAVIEPPEPGGVGLPPAEYDFYIGNALFQLERLDEAVEAWERCRDKRPDYAMVYNNLALAYWKQGRMDDALAALERAEELGFPVNPDFGRDLRQAAAG